MPFLTALLLFYKMDSPKCLHSLVSWQTMAPELDSPKLVHAAALCSVQKSDLYRISWIVFSFASSEPQRKLEKKVDRECCKISSQRKKRKCETIILRDIHRQKAGEIQVRKRDLNITKVCLRCLNKYRKCEKRRVIERD